MRYETPKLASNESIDSFDVIEAQQAHLNELKVIKKGQKDLKKIFPSIEEPSYDNLPPTKNNNKAKTFDKYDKVGAKKNLH
jgi:hypothetical protein